MNPNCSSKFLFSSIIFYEYDFRTPATHTWPDIPSVPSLRHSQFLVIRPNPDLSRPDLQQLFYCDQNQVWIHLLLSRLARKQWFRNLLHWRLQFVSPIRTSTELQLETTQTNSRHNTDILNEIFVKINFLSNSHSDIILFILVSLASQSSPAFRRNEILMKSFKHSSTTSNRIYSFRVQVKKGLQQTRCENYN